MWRKSDVRKFQIRIDFSFGYSSPGRASYCPKWTVSSALLIQNKSFYVKKDIENLTKINFCLYSRPYNSQTATTAFELSNVGVRGMWIFDMSNFDYQTEPISDFEAGEKKYAFQA